MIAEGGGGDHMPFFRKAKSEPEPLLDPGWQFYSRPTTMDGPGTVFRIDGAGKKFTVQRLELKIERGNEAEISMERVIETEAGILARFLALHSAGAKAQAGHVRRLKFSLGNPIMEVTLDNDVRDAVDKFKKHLDYDVHQRYFIIRAARSASSMKYQLSHELVGELGGTAEIEGAIEAGINVRAGAEGLVQIDQHFQKQMRVMFLPEEIKVIAAGLSRAVPELGLKPVREVLHWTEMAAEGKCA